MTTASCWNATVCQLTYTRTAIELLSTRLLRYAVVCWCMCTSYSCWLCAEADVICSHELVLQHFPCAVLQMCIQIEIFRRSLGSTVWPGILLYIMTSCGLATALQKALWQHILAWWVLFSALQAVCMSLSICTACVGCQVVLCNGYT